jgi:hypothetical protein
VGFRAIVEEFETIWGENMEAEYATAKEWYKANRRELKKYRGQWIAYTNEGVISCDRDYDKMKDGIPADIPNLSYVIDRIHESEFSESVRFPGFHCCN